MRVQVIDVSEVKLDSRGSIAQSENNIYLDEMERLMLRQVNTAIEERHSSLPRSSEGGKRGSTLDIFKPKREESGARNRDLLGRWCEEASDVYWTVRSDGIAQCDTGAKLTLRDKNKQGVWVVSRSDGMVNTSIDTTFIVWRSKVGRSTQAIKWTRYQPEKHGVDLFRHPSALSVKERVNEIVQEEVHEVEDKSDTGSSEVHPRHRDRGSVSQGPRKASRPSALSFLKVMRKGVLIEVLAGQLVLSAQAVEPSLTELLVSIAAESKGELVGLDHRLKTPESLAMKIGRDVHDANLRILEDMENRRRKVGSAVALVQVYIQTQTHFILTSYTHESHLN